MSAAGMLAQMRKALGWGEPNAVHRWYGARNGAVFGKGSTPWCQMTVTWAAWHSGNYAAVCPRGDRAYTVWSAEDGERLGRWYAGTAENIRKYARPGAVVYIDWGGSDRIGRIDHVGIVEVNLGDGRLQTIEGNTADACKRRVRGPSVIAGFWNPDYEPKEGKKMTGEALFKTVWHRDAIKVPWGTPDNPTWQPQSILVDNGKRLRAIEAKLDAQNATIRELVAALAQRDSEIDVDAVVQRIETAIAGITVRLDVGDQPPVPQP
ncbi:CHAP domain-containing protein [Nonomuraea sp. 10N515B]|uniref:CHAP domain-containing protein n=1 Tax=Nonomuraea sp. 10N515B TaxID=3457422 RepID=UPI003FCE2967